MADPIAKQIADTRIMQKVNGVYRDAFAQKYPGQVDHCLRLVMERLQHGLDKRDGVVLEDPTTWRLSTGELADLAETAFHLHNIKQSFNLDDDR